MPYSYVPLLERYRDFLPINETTPQLSLGEGGTPLIHATHLESLLGCERLYLKCEGLNPTGSFKDRGMVLAIAKAMENGSRLVICASTGNTAASAAAYAAAANLACCVVLPSGHVALGKLSQAMLYGACVVPLAGNFDVALGLVLEAANHTGAVLVNSLNPHRLEGQKTAAFELCDELDAGLDILALPVGNGGNITAYWQGFKEFHAVGRLNKLPAMWGFQASGAAPLVEGRAFENPETVASAIRIGKPARGGEALDAVRESKGSLSSVSDPEILDAYRLVASLEGVMCEPASAAPIAGLLKLARTGIHLSTKTIVVVLTGHGLKDPVVASSQVVEPTPMEPRIDALLAMMATL